LEGNTKERSVYWNYRVVKADDWEGYEVREVYYDENDVPYAHGSAALLCEDMEGLRQVFEWMKAALEKPILEAKDFKKEGAI
jgi:hypothetical protein